MTKLLISLIIFAVSAAGQLANSVAPMVCAEQYLTSAMGGDYGQAINAAIQAASSTTQTEIAVCLNGDHNLGTQIVFDRPIAFWQGNSRFLLQSSLAATPVKLTGCTLTQQTKTVSGCSTTSLAVGMAVGGIGIQAGSYIRTITDSTHFVLSNYANLQTLGFPTSGSPTISGVSTMQGWAASQSVTGAGIPASTTISSVNYSSNTLTLNNNSTLSLTYPTTIILASAGTWTSNIKAVATIPAMLWKYNASALLNSELQNIGGEMHGVWMVDPNNRALTGVQGVQIYGWDRIKCDHLQIENLAGSALILGGVQLGTNGEVRESTFYNTELRDSGEGTTGQSVLEIITGAEGDQALADNDNQIEFVQGQIAFNYGEAVTVGEYNTNHTGNNGPRLIWFEDNFQIEGGSHVTSMNMPSPYNSFHIAQGHDIYFQGDEIAAAGYGHALFQVDAGAFLGVTQSSLYNTGKEVSFGVTVTNGSPIVTWTSGGNSQFDPSGFWDAQGLQINDGATCTPCNFLAGMQGSVASNGLTLTLASNYTGTTGTATLKIGAAGYYFSIPGTNGNTLNKLTALGNFYTDPDTFTTTLLSLSVPTYSFLAGSGVNSSGVQIPCVTDYPVAGAGNFLSVGCGTSSQSAFIQFENSRGFIGYNGTAGSLAIQGAGKPIEIANGGVFASGTRQAVFDTSNGFGIGTNISSASDPFHVTSAGAVTAIKVNPGYYTFATLPASPSNGDQVVCSDCTIANPTAGSGSGALVVRIGGVWVGK